MTHSDLATEPPPRRPEQSPLRRRWPGIASGVMVVLVAAAASGAAVFHHGLPWWKGQGDRSHEHRSEAGARGSRFTCHRSTPARPASLWSWRSTGAA